jgi:type II secretory pathway component PulK
MADGRCFYHPSSVVRHPSAGSVLVMVLWMLVLISFLAGQYLAHNREKADIAQNAWTSFRQRQAVSSVVNLFSTNSWPLADGTGADGRWFRLFPDDMALWVRVGKESQRTHLNTAPDGEIKQKIALIMGDNLQREADAVSDCILDWRDADSLTRMKGAEEKDYEVKNVTYRPANGPFKVMSEMLLVMGVTPELFWADPVKWIEADLSSYYIQTELQKEPVALSDVFTIYSGETRRINLLVPGSETGYLYMNIFMGTQSGHLAVVDSQQFMGVAEGGFDRLVELESEVRGLDARGKNRS